jgi:hypothetical protein
MSAARPKRSRRTSKSPPDLSPIFDVLSDAYGLISTAYKVSAQQNGGPEQVALRLGVEALERGLEQLDKADVQLSQYNATRGNKA